MRVLMYCRGEENPGVAYLMAALARDGHQTGLLFDPGFEDVFLGGGRLFQRLFSAEDLARRARAFRPDVVGYNTLTLSYHAVRRVAALIRESCGAIQVAGGPHASAVPEAVLQNTAFDYVLVGEGDTAFPELVRRLAEGGDAAGAPNVVSRGAPLAPERLAPLVADLDALPLPDRRAFREAGAARRRLGLLTGRGCPFACAYCSHSVRQELYRGKGKYYRLRSVENVLTEIESAIPDGYTSVRFWDDLFGFRREWLLDFLPRYRERIGLPFSATMHVESIDERIARELRDSGCTRIALGVQSGDETVRRRVLARRESVERSREAIGHLKRAGVFVLAEVMLGLPGETADQMDATARLCLETRPDNVSAFIYFPMPGSRLVEDAVREGWLEESTLDAVARGELATASWHKKSLLRQRDAPRVYRLKVLLPLAARFPALARLVFGNGGTGWIRALYIFSIIFVDQKEFWQKLKDYFNIFVSYFRIRDRVPEGVR